MIGGVALAHLVHALGERHRLTAWPDGHVRVPEEVTHKRVLVDELRELVGQSDELGLDGCRRVVGHKPG